jgi:hypothetical protein
MHEEKKTTRETLDQYYSCQTRTSLVTETQSNENKAWIAKNKNLVKSIVQQIKYQKTRHHDDNDDQAITFVTSFINRIVSGN